MAYKTHVRAWYVDYIDEKRQDGWHYDHVSYESLEKVMNEVEAFANDNGWRVISVNTLENRYRFQKGMGRASHISHIRLAPW